MNDPLVVLATARVDGETNNLNFMPYRNTIAIGHNLLYSELIDQTLSKLDPKVCAITNRCIVNSSQFDAQARSKIFDYLAVEKKSRIHPSTVLNAHGTSTFISIKKHIPSVTDSFKLEYACASGLKSLELIDKIASDDVYLLLAAEVPISDYYEYMLHSLGATAKFDQYHSPFDLKRAGLALGNGAAAMIITKQSTAKKYGVNPIAVINSVSAYTSANHPTDPISVSELVDFVEATIQRSGIKKDSIAYWDAHATGTVKGDSHEYQAFNKIFADTDCKISSFKSRIGHTMAASSLIESVHAIEYLQQSLIPGNYNISTPLNSDKRIITEQISTNKKTFVKCSFGFSGKNACAVITVLK